MDLFLSWSKARSHSLALILHQWIPDVIQQVRPWMSSENIDKGQRWALEVGSRLDSGSQGIICITSENVGEPWLNFEAGALAKSLAEGRVRPLLLDLRPAEVKGPLSQFQATVVSDKADMQRLVRSLNEQCPEPLDDGRLAKAFEKGWKDFEQELARVQPAVSNEKPPSRPVDDMMRELLERVREMQRSMTSPSHTLPSQKMSFAEREYSESVQLAFTRLGWSFFPIQHDRGIDGVLIIRPSLALNIIITRKLALANLVVHIGRHKAMLRLDSTIQVLVIADSLPNAEEARSIVESVDSFHFVTWRNSDDDGKIREAVAYLLPQAAEEEQAEPGRI